MNARDAILRKLRSTPRDEVVPLPNLGGWEPAPAWSAAEKLNSFRQSMLAAQAEIHDTTPAQWRQTLAQIVQAKGVKTLAVGQGVDVGAMDAQIISYDRAVESWKDHLFTQVDAGFTYARSAIAQTGSIVLWPDANEPRLLSLVPPIHFVLVSTARLHASLAQAMASEDWAGGMPTNALIISGPSKTADIQQTLAYGAHGPRELVVLLCHESAGTP